MVRSEGPLDTNETYHLARSGRGGVKEQRRGWANLYAWQLARSGDAPLFRQIYLQIRSAILSQSLRPGTKLPSTRQLAALPGCSDHLATIILAIPIRAACPGFAR